MNQVNTVANKKYEVIFEGEKYIKNNDGWRRKDFTIPRQNIIVKLNKLLEDVFLKEVENSNYTVEELIKKADIEKNSKNFVIAERYIKKAISKSPENLMLYAKLCSFLRELGKPEEALAETEKIKNYKNSALSISRAGAMCDLGRYLEAKKEIAPILASGSTRSKEYAFFIVNRIKKEAPELYERSDLFE